MLTQPAKANKSSSHPIVRTSTPLERLLAEAIVNDITRRTQRQFYDPSDVGLRHEGLHYESQHLRARGLSLMANDLDVSGEEAATVRAPFLAQLTVLGLREKGFEVTYWEKDIVVEAGYRHNFLVRRPQTAQ